MSRAEPPSFHPEHAAGALAAFLPAQHLDIDTSSTTAVMEGMLRFYESVAAAGLADEPDADMLLFEWGVYDWGRGEQFEVSLTRQFAIADEEGDDALSQLRLVASFAATPEAKQLPAGNLWCDRHIDTPHLRRFMADHKALQLAASMPRLRAEIVWSPV